MQNYVQEIKASISMDDICAQYGIEVNRARKVLCPFHQDSKPSMHIYRGQRGFYCFVCHSGGDVIDFTQQYFGITFGEAQKKLNQDFELGLPIGGQLDKEAKRKADQKARQRRREIRERKKHHQRLQKAYHAALDRFIELDKTMTQNAPERTYGVITDAYSNAARRIEAAAYAVDMAELRLAEFEQKQSEE